MSEKPVSAGGQPPQEARHFHLLESVDLGPCVIEISETDPEETDPYINPPSMLVLKTKEGKAVDLSSLLPQPPHRSYKNQYGKPKRFPQFFFCNVGVWRHEPYVGSILYDAEELRKAPHMIFMLLHEMGHAISRETHDDEYRRQGEENKDSGGEHSPGAVIVEERYAWAQAIKLARTLRDTYGIDLFFSFPKNRYLWDFCAWKDCIHTKKHISTSVIPGVKRRRSLKSSRQLNIGIGKRNRMPWGVLKPQRLSECAVIF